MNFFYRSTSVMDALLLDMLFFVTEVFVLEKHFYYGTTSVSDAFCCRHTSVTEAHL